MKANEVRQMETDFCPRCNRVLKISKTFSAICVCGFNGNIWCPIDGCLGFLDKYGNWQGCMANAHGKHNKTIKNVQTK